MSGTGSGKIKNIGNFVNGTKAAVRDLAAEFSIDLTIKLKKLQELGVVVLKGELKFTTYQGKGYALVYNGEIIAEGTVKDLIREVFDIWKKAVKDANIAKYLDEIVDIKILTKNERYKAILLKTQKKQYLSEYLIAEEEAVIIYYTTSAYEKLNQALRGLITMDDENQAFANTLNRALSKLPNSVYNGPRHLLYRSFKMDEAHLRVLFKPKATYLEKAFLSASEDYDSFLNYWLKENPGHNVIMKIQGKSGKSIKAVSDIPEEREALFRSGIEFEIVSVVKTKHPLKPLGEIFEIILKEK